MTPPFRLTGSVAAILATFSLGAHGADWVLAGGRLDLKGSAFLGTVHRADGRDPGLLPAANAALVGASGTAPNGKNQDDGNLNFANGDAVSTALKGHLTLGYQRGDWGLVARVVAWHDFALADGNRPWGNLPNGLSAGVPLSDAGFARRARFSGIVVDDLFAHGRAALGSASLAWKAGQFKLDWGGRFTIAGGLGDLSPRDLPAQRRAGALPEDGRIPVPALAATLALTPATTLEGFVQAGFRPNVAHGCGTFFAASDFVADGCDKAVLGLVSDRSSLANGAFVKRAANQMPSGLGQAGLGLRHKLPVLDAELGAYLAQFHARAAFFSAIKSRRATGAPFLPKDPGGLNPQYVVEYPEHIRVLGLTLEKKLAAGAVMAELTYRPNQPFQYNAVDLLTAFATEAGATPLRAGATATAAGDVFRGYERHPSVQLNVGLVHGLPALLGAQGGNVGVELAYRQAPDLPDPVLTRFRRPDVYGQAPVGGATCPVTASAVTCSLDGFVTASALAYRLRAGLRYPQLISGVDVLPTLTFGHDVRGWSEDGAMSEGRQFAVLSLKAEVRQAWSLEFVWQPVWGGNYNNARDRSTVSLALGYRF